MTNDDSRSIGNKMTDGIPLTDHGVPGYVFGTRTTPSWCTPIVALMIQPEASPGLGHSTAKVPRSHFRDDWSRRQALRDSVLVLPYFTYFSFGSRRELWANRRPPTVVAK